MRRKTAPVDLSKQPRFSFARRRADTLRDRLANAKRGFATIEEPHPTNAAYIVERLVPLSECRVVGFESESGVACPKWEVRRDTADD